MTSACLRNSLTLLCGCPAGGQWDRLAEDQVGRAARLPVS